MGNKSLSVLFIGNSHTYYNDLPAIMRKFAEADGYDCRVVMLAHGGWFLDQHVKEPDVKFDILHGGFNYVVLQEHAHPFGPIERFRDAARTLTGWIHEAGSIPVLYETWSQKSEPDVQTLMNETYRSIADETDSLLTPVGENWWNYKENNPSVEMYAGDGAHASPAGSEFAAKYIWKTIREDIEEKKGNSAM